MHAAKEPHVPPLGRLLVERGILNAAEMAEALAVAKFSGSRVGEILLERGWVDERRLALLLAEQEGLAFVDLGKYDLDPRAVSLVSEATARLHRAIPYAFDEDVALVAVADPADGAVIDAVEAEAGPRVRFVVATASEVASALAEAYDA